MTADEFVSQIRAEQALGIRQMNAKLTKPFKGCKYVRIVNLDGHKNRNPHDIWIIRRDGTCIGRAYLGSKNMAQDLDGWPQRIEGMVGA